MIYSRIGIVTLLSVTICGTALANDWTGITTPATIPPPTDLVPGTGIIVEYSRTGGRDEGLSGTLSGNEQVLIYLGKEDGGNVISTSIPLADFARAGAVSGLSTDIDMLKTQIASLNRRADEGVAMAAALSPMMPADGKTNRLGFSGSGDSEQGAFAVNYTHVADSFDFSVGVAATQDHAMARAGVGYSW